jgi:hypothetical protein
MLNGQWFGTIEGTNTGFAILNLEYVDDHYEGQLFINDDNPLLPSTIAKVVIKIQDADIIDGEISGFFPINDFTLLPTLKLPMGNRQLICAWNKLLSLGKPSQSLSLPLIRQPWVGSL